MIRTDLCRVNIQSYGAAVKVEGAAAHPVPILVQLAIKVVAIKLTVVYNPATFVQHSKRRVHKESTSF